MPEIVIHHMVGSRSDRIVWLVEELGLPYTLVVHVPSTATGKVTSTLTDHVPGGKAPSVYLDGELLKESAFIVDTLLSRFPSASIETTPSRDSVYWSHFAEGRVMSAFGAMVQTGAALPVFLKTLSSTEQRAGAAALAQHTMAHLAAEAGLALAEAEAFLATHEYFSGTDKPGIGDFMMLFPLNWVARARGVPGNLTLGPATSAWVARLAARPAHARAFQRIASERAKQHPRKNKL